MSTKESDALWAHVAAVVDASPSSMSFPERKAIAVKYATDQYDAATRNWKRDSDVWDRRVIAAADVLNEARAWDHSRYCSKRKVPSEWSSGAKYAEASAADAWARARYDAMVAETDIPTRAKMRTRMLADGLRWYMRLREATSANLRGWAGLDRSYRLYAAGPRAAWLGEVFGWAWLGEVFGWAREMVEDRDTYIKEPVDNSDFVMPSDVGAALRTESPIGLGGAQGGWGGYED